MNEETQKQIDSVISKLNENIAEATKGFVGVDEYNKVVKSMDDLTEKLDSLKSDVVSDEAFKAVQDGYKTILEKLATQGDELNRLKNSGVIDNSGRVKRSSVRSIIEQSLADASIIKKAVIDEKEFDKVVLSKGQSHTFKDVNTSVYDIATTNKAGENVYVFNTPAGSQSLFNQAVPRDYLDGWENPELSANDHLSMIFSTSNMAVGEIMTLMVRNNEELNAQLVLEGAAPTTQSRIEATSKDFKVFDYRATAKVSEKMLRSASDLIDELTIQLADDMQEALDAQLFTDSGDNDSTPYGIFNQTHSCTLFNALDFEGLAGSKANIVSVAAFAKLQARLLRYRVDSMILNPITYTELEELRDADGNSIMDRRLAYDQIGSFVAIAAMKKAQSTYMAQNTMLVYNSAKQVLKFREGISTAFGYENAEFSKNIVTMKMDFAAAYGQRAKASAIYVDDITTAISILGATAAESLVRVQAYATGSDASALTISTLINTGATDVIAANLDAYKVAVAAEASIADLAALQVVVDAVNAA